MGIIGITSILLSTSGLSVILLKSNEVEEIMLQVSTLSTSSKLDGDGNIKVPISEGSLTRPTSTF